MSAAGRAPRRTEVPAELATLRSQSHIWAPALTSGPRSPRAGRGPGSGSSGEAGSPSGLGRGRPGRRREPRTPVSRGPGLTETLRPEQLPLGHFRVAAARGGRPQREGAGLWRLAPWKAASLSAGAQAAAAPGVHGRQPAWARAAAPLCPQT